MGDSSLAPRRAASANGRAPQTPPPLPACRSGGIGSGTSTKTLRTESLTQQQRPDDRAHRLGTGTPARRSRPGARGAARGACTEPEATRPSPGRRTQRRGPPALRPLRPRGGGGAHLAQLPAVGGGGLHGGLPALAQPPLQLLQPLAQAPQLRRAAAAAQALLLGLIVRHLRSPLRRVRTWVT